MRFFRFMVIYPLMVLYVEASPARRARKSSNPSRAPAPSTTLYHDPLVRAGATLVPFSPSHRQVPSQEPDVGSPGGPNAVRSLLSTEPDAILNKQDRASVTHARPPTPMVTESHLPSGPELVLRNENRDKGKAAVVSTATSVPASSLSPSEDLGAPSHQTFAPVTSTSVASPSARAKPAPPPGTSKPVVSVYKRRRIFKEQWDKLNIDWDNLPDPLKLAQAVKTLRVPGLNPRSIGQLASHQVRENTSEAYLAAYRYKSDQINAKKSNTTLQRKRRQAKLNGVRRSEKTEKKYTQRFTQVDKGSGGAKSGIVPSSKSHPRVMRARERYDEIVKALEKKKIWSLSPGGIEEATRDFTLGKHTPRYVNTVIGSHLRNLGRHGDAQTFKYLRDLQRRKDRYQQMSKEERLAFVNKSKKGKKKQDG